MTIENVGEVPSVVNIVLDLVPKNSFKSFAEGNVAHIVVFGLVLGFAVLLLPNAQRTAFHSAADLIAAALRKMVDLVLRLGPIGVGALGMATAGEYGTQIFGPLSWFVITCWIAQSLMVVFYLTFLWFMTGRNPFSWLKQTATLYATTSATCSSLASLAVSMEVAEKRLSISEKIYGFTLPLGAQLNKDGTSIFLVVLLLFTAQAIGKEFAFSELLSIIFVGLLLSEGSGGIPSGGIVIAYIFVEHFNLPLEIATVVVGIYRLIDMGSTTINCMGDLVWTTTLSDISERKSENLPNDESAETESDTPVVVDHATAEEVSA